MKREPILKHFPAVWLACAGGALGLLGTTACHRTNEVEAKQNAGAPIPVISVAKAKVGDLSDVTVLTAEFTPYQQVDLMAKVSGYVKRINVDIGDHVQQGQLLAVLEVPELNDDVTKAEASVQRSQSQVAQAQDEVRRAESNYQIAHLSFSRLDEVMKSRPGLVAQQEVDDAQSKDTSAEAQVQAAKSSLAAAVQQVSVSKADLGKYKTMFDYARVTAPFDGVITKRYANTGSMIQAGTASQTQAMPVVQLSENRLLRLILPVPESAVPGVHVGQQVDVRVPTLGRTFPGKVARFADKLQMATRTMDTEVDVQNPSLKLVPGMYAEVDLTLRRSNGAVFVPVGAVDMNSAGGGGGDDDEPAGMRTNRPAQGKVMVVTPVNRLEQRTVTVGMQTANRTEILAGLRDGELVVVGDKSALKAGDMVKPKLSAMAAEGAK